jgi:hypothetical protein
MTRKLSKKDADKAAEDSDIVALSDFLVNYPDKTQLTEWYKNDGYEPINSPEENACQIIRSTQYFDSWDEFEQFRVAMRHEGSDLWQFEQATDAIASGEEVALKKLLQQNPRLVHMRSVRNHHSTLLNYVGANGFEWYRQKTPKNAAEIARILLDAGSEVDAWGDMYGGTSTLGLVATSVHPVNTGVQQEIMEVLIAHGADPNHAVAPNYTDGMLILACLHNGRVEPLKYLAQKGAKVDLEGAGGVGDLEIVKSYFETEGTLIDSGLNEKLNACFCWACQSGNKNVVEYLLAQGIDVNTRSLGMTALHSAAFDGHIEIVKLLLSLNADMEAINAFGGTVLSQTIWCHYNHFRPAHPQIMEILIGAGAHVNEEWKPYIHELRHRHNNDFA